MDAALQNQKPFARVRLRLKIEKFLILFGDVVGRQDHFLDIGRKFQFFVGFAAYPSDLDDAVARKAVLQFALAVMNV